MTHYILRDETGNTVAIGDEQECGRGALERMGGAWLYRKASGTMVAFWRNDFQKPVLNFATDCGSIFTATDELRQYAFDNLRTLQPRWSLSQIPYPRAVP